MFLISIAMGHSQPVIWTLMFRTQERATESFKLLQENLGDIAVNDDFGQTINVEKANIGGMLLEDLDQSRNAHIERALHEARLRANLETRARSDPILKHAAMTGPAMLQPMGNGRG
jgi:hypothetical protein